MAAIWVDTLIRFKQEGYKPKRTIKMALTCGEETSGAFNGARMAGQEQARPDRRGVRAQRRRRRPLDGQGKPRRPAHPGRREGSQNFRLEVTNPGGHSSRPGAGQRDLPPGRRAAKSARLRVPGPVQRHHPRLLQPATARPRCRRADGQAIAELAANPADEAADAMLSRDRQPSTRSCAPPASPPCSTAATPTTPCRSGPRANINCRIFPGETVRGDAAKLSELAGPKVKVTATSRSRPTAVPPPLDPKIIGPARRLAAKISPACR